MTDALVIVDPETWPVDLMRGLSPKEQLYAVHRARGASQAEAASMAGYQAGSVRNLRACAYGAEHRPAVARAIKALKAHHGRQHAQQEIV